MDRNLDRTHTFCIESLACSLEILHQPDRCPSRFPHLAQGGLKPSAQDVHFHIWLHAKGIRALSLKRCSYGVLLCVVRFVGIGLPAVQAGTVSAIAELGRSWAWRFEDFGFGRVRKGPWPRFGRVCCARLLLKEHSAGAQGTLKGPQVAHRFLQCCDRRSGLRDVWEWLGSCL